MKHVYTRTCVQTAVLFSDSGTETIQGPSGGHGTEHHSATSWNEAPTHDAAWTSPAASHSEEQDLDWATSVEWRWQRRPHSDWLAGMSKAVVVLYARKSLIQLFGEEIQGTGGSLVNTLLSYLPCFQKAILAETKKTKLRKKITQNSTENSNNHNRKESKKYELTG